MKTSEICLVCGVAMALLNCFLFGARTCEASWGEQARSIHFNSGEPDFGQVPRRAVLVGEPEIHESDTGPEFEQDTTTKQDGIEWLGELSEDRTQAQADEKARRDAASRTRATSCVAHSRFRDALAVYSKLAARDGWSGDLRDRVETLAEALREPTAARTNAQIQRYFGALDRIYKTDGMRENAAMPILAQIAANHAAGFLRSHALYQIASLYSEWLDFPKAIALYQELLRRYPDSSKRQAALIMIARDALLPAKRQARTVEVGAQAVESLLAIGPGSRFHRSALGLRARVDYLHGRNLDAIHQYLALADMESVEQVLAAMPPRERRPLRVAVLAGWLRKLNDADTFHGYDLATEFVRRSVASLNPGDAGRFVALLHRQPDLAAPYLYYRLYLCDNSSRDLAHLSDLANALAVGYARQKGSSLSPLIQIRLAEVNYGQGRYATAIRWAAGANSHYPGATPYDRALYVTGASLQKLGRTRAAPGRFEALLRDCPASKLRFAAHEELALLRETNGDLAGALNEYFVLDYRPDIAFFLDARMSTAEVARFVALHPHHREHDLLVYSLGIRYLRDENWSAARLCLSRLPKKVYTSLGTSEDDGGYHAWDQSDGPDPLKAARTLAALQRAVDRAPTANRRASALFRLADYYYKSPLLLLYNGALWKGGREFNFDFLWNARHATSADLASTSSHMYDHETYARAERICLKIVQDFPHSPTRPYALYRAACCENKLAGFNGWWRSDNRHHDHYLLAARLMARLARQYPRHPLAWEARKFAHVFSENSRQLAEDRRQEATEMAKERSNRGDERSGDSRPGPGSYP